MEIVLQWLDDLDDLAFAGFSIWRRLRRLFLAVALAASVAVHVPPRIGLGIEISLALLAISLLAVSAWCVFAALTHGADRSALSVASNA